MPRRDPDHRAKLIFELAETNQPFEGDHPDERGLYQLLTIGNSPLNTVVDAYELYQHSDDRHIMNALILAKGTDLQIATALSMSPTLVVTFRHLFFDRSVFRHDLDVKNYTIDLQVPSKQKTYYEMANTQSFQKLANVFHIGAKAPIQPKEVMEELMGDMLDRAISHRGQAITSDIARECLNWGRAAMSAANILMKTEPSESKNLLEELKIALRVEDHTNSIEELDIQPGDLYH